jgi:hypothetical protein
MAEVKSETLFAYVKLGKVITVAPPGRRILACRISAARFHLDDFRAEVREDAGTERSREDSA